MVSTQQEREPTWVLDEGGSHDLSQTSSPFRTNGSLLWPPGLIAVASHSCALGGCSENSDPPASEGRGPKESWVQELLGSGLARPFCTQSKIIPGPSSTPLPPAPPPSLNGAARFLLPSQARTVWRRKCSHSEDLITLRWGWQAAEVGGGGEGLRGQVAMSPTKG